jgi:aryl-alcohol dehydrogenase-like predicted oxidoreductase
LYITTHTCDREGKIKFIGLCECNGETLRRAHKVHPISAIQVEYSPFTLDAEDPKIDALRTAHELGVTVFAYSPLGRGLLIGKYVRLHHACS